MEADPRSASAHFALGNILARLGDSAGGVRHLREAVRFDPSFAAAFCNLGLLLHEMGDVSAARAALDRALALDPGNADFSINRRVVAAHPVPLWHFSMMNDAARNEAYDAALRAATSEGDVVLEIGTGSGLLAMMAARAGAGHVYTCEMVEALASKAREIVEANGCGDKITVLPKPSTAVSIPDDLPAPANVLVAEIIATDLLGEGLLPSYEDAKARLLAPGARIIPRQAWVRGALASAVGLERFTRVEAVSGFDLRSFNEYAPLKVHPGEVEMEVALLSPVFDIFHFDFEAQASFPPQRRSFTVPVFQPGTCVGILQWIRLDLGGGVMYENSQLRPERAGHWQPVLHLFSPPLEVKPHDNVVVTAAHNRSNLLFHAHLEPGLAVRILG